MNMMHAISFGTQQFVKKKKDNDVILAPILVQLDLHMLQVSSHTQDILFLRATTFRVIPSHAYVDPVWKHSPTRL
jgi:hypothetical protein